MKIEASWSQPIPLKKGKPGGLIYELDLTQLPIHPGVYIFGRAYGKNVAPIYIGETLSIRGRIKSHLNSLSLMRAIEGAPNGKRFLIYCGVETKSREKAKKQIKAIERALILHAQTEGHVLFNKKGTKLPTDEIAFTGNRTSEGLAPRVMLVRRAPSRSKTASAET
ncbi:GIY-YIG nuclease family protein [Burkholderia gladioli]|uniref:GIY-YIG nuclease family protein n=1 Tax=Burkholderia gladioli TaxID=28095 RepID=UPI00164168F3|nr:GIY-YIG nuclease family protein [Burkholderia gladioli]